MSLHFPVSLAKNSRFCFSLHTSRLSLLKMVTIVALKFAMNSHFPLPKKFRPLCSDSLTWRESRDEWSKTQVTRSNPAQPTVESGKHVTFFEQLFCFYQLVLVVWNTFGAKFKLSFISWVKQNWHFFLAMEENIALPPFGGTFGGNGGPGTIISPVAGSVGLRDSPLFTRSPYQVYRKIAI